MAMSGASTQESYANPLNVATANGGKIFMAGDEVYALFDGDWHAATVVKMNGQRVDITYDGYEHEVVTVDVSDIHSG